MYTKAPENLSRNKNRYLFKPSWMQGTKRKIKLKGFKRKKKSDV